MSLLPLPGGDGAVRDDTLRSVPPLCEHSGPGRGQLGLQGGHREMADLIRSCEVLAAGGDDQALHDSAQRVLQMLVRHIDAERSLVSRIPASQRGRLLAGQRVLLERATGFATHPAPDAGADLLALLVRQADIEESAANAERERSEEWPAEGGQFEFTTDWAMTGAPLLVGFPYQ